MLTTVIRSSSAIDRLFLAWSTPLTINITLRRFRSVLFENLLIQLFANADLLETRWSKQGDFVISNPSTQSALNTIILSILERQESLIYERDTSLIWNLKIKLNPINTGSWHRRLKSWLTPDQSVNTLAQSHAPYSRCQKRRETNRLLSGWINRIKLRVCIPIKRHANQMPLPLEWWIWICISRRKWGRI